MWTYGVLLLMIATLVVLVAPRFIRRDAQANAVNGTLLITGVSPRPDASGQQYVTIAGVITGPTVNEHEVYQRMIVDVDEWPTMGQLLPVVYSRKDPDNWTLAPPTPPASSVPPEQLEPPEQPAD